MLIVRRACKLSDVRSPNESWKAGPVMVPERLPVRRRLSPAAGRALEMLSHAIEYLADEYAASVDDKGPLGSADPRVEAIQILKAHNRALYYSGTEVPTAIGRIRRRLAAARPSASRSA